MQASTPKRPPVIILTVVLLATSVAISLPRVIREADHFSYGVIAWIGVAICLLITAPRAARWVVLPLLSLFTIGMLYSTIVAFLTPGYELAMVIGPILSGLMLFWVYSYGWGKSARAYYAMLKVQPASNPALNTDAERPQRAG